MCWCSYLYLRVPHQHTTVCSISSWSYGARYGGKTPPDSASPQTWCCFTGLLMSALKTEVREQKSECAVITKDYMKDWNMIGCCPTTTTLQYVHWYVSVDILRRYTELWGDQCKQTLDYLYCMNRQSHWCLGSIHRSVICPTAEATDRWVRRGGNRRVKHVRHQ